MVGHPLFVHDSVSASVAGDDIVRVAAIGTPAIAKLLAFGNDPQGCLKSQLGSVDDDISGMGPLDFFKPGIDPVPQVYNAGLKSFQVRPSIGLGFCSKKEKKQALLQAVKKRNFKVCSSAQ